MITPRGHRKTVAAVNLGASHQKSNKKKDKPIGRSGSYNLKQQKHTAILALDENAAAPHSFRRCISEQENASSSKSKQPCVLAGQTDICSRQHADKAGENDFDNVDGIPCPELEADLPPPSTIPTRSAHKRPPPPIPQRVSSLKPKCDTPKSACCASEKISPKTGSANCSTLSAIPGVSATPMPAGT